eukprot:TRINITY_DN1818_c0_g2_i1.p1 TRINITY_DN1818_c0_g2~~TRINITY_DN1818_c0_g2_i1.p1  ORF type:complete len:760 (+),score=162.36 TRINITY_DN1818_c0_g2_i1:146-2425(+)
MNMAHAVGVFLLVLVLGITNAQTPVPIPRACSSPTTNQYPFCNPKLSLDERIHDLIGRLQDEEKPPMMTARESPKGNVSRLGIPEYDWGANCVHGVQSRCGTKCPTSFANPNGLGATFNMSNVYAMAQVIGLELRSLWLQGVGENNGNNLPHLGLDCWSPNININRDPRWGRNQEVPGEDPYLSGQFAYAYTTGLQQGEDKRFLQAVVTLKHWAAYSLEDIPGTNINRYNFNAIVNSYDWANTYTPAFKAAVVEGKAKGVMCSYNALNNIPTCASTFLNNTLRGDWGFDGYVTSDSGAVGCIQNNHHYVSTNPEACAAAIKGGTDIDSGGDYDTSLLLAVSQNLIKISDVDLSLYRVLKIRFELGLFDPIDDQPYWHVSPDVVNTPASQALNLLATQQTLVLLKNSPLKGSSTLTLPFPKGKKVAVIGPHGNATGDMVGNYLGQICPDRSFDCVVSPFLAIQKLNVGGTTVYVEGTSVSGNTTSGFDAAIQAASAADYVVLMIGLDQGVEGEMHDRVNITLPGVQDQFSQKIISLGKPTAVVLLNGGAVAIDWIHDEADVAVLEAFYPGFQGGNAIATAIFGDYNPGGKMPYTVYRSDYIHQVNMTSMDMSLAPGRTYRYFKGAPLWPFGYGLTYTAFTLAWHNESDHHQFDENTEVPVHKLGAVTYVVTVNNTGKVAGDEVVQAYFQSPTDQKLIRQLFGFQRVHLLPGQQTEVKFTLSPSTFELGDEEGTVQVGRGVYTLHFTNGVDMTLSTSLTVA